MKLAVVAHRESAQGTQSGSWEVAWFNSRRQYVREEAVRSQSRSGVGATWTTSASSSTVEHSVLEAEATEGWVVQIPPRALCGGSSMVCTSNWYLTRRHGGSNPPHRTNSLSRH